jgi:hypothetical protein
MRKIYALLLAGFFVASCSEDDDLSSTTVALRDPGTAEWQPVPRAEVANRCGLDAALLDAADAQLNEAYAIVRYGELCHEYYPDGPDTRSEVYSTTKSLGAVVTGIAIYETRDIPRTGPKSGPLSDEDRVDYWLDDFSFNQDALVANVLAMNAHNEDLSYGHKNHEYDTFGTVQINRMSDIVNTAIAQDPDRLGGNIDDLTVHYLFEPLGMTDSDWNSGLANKVFAFSWHSTIRDMARVGLLVLHGGMWSGRRIVDGAWIYKMTHPSFEDANTAYGYLTWLNSASNYNFGFGTQKAQTPIDPCAPRALRQTYPNPISGAPDCNYEAPWTCDQEFDVGMWYFAGLNGQYVVGHRGLDLLIVAKNSIAGPTRLWQAVRPALVALDPNYQGDEDAFCADYGTNAYAPDLQ